MRTLTDRIEGTQLRLLLALCALRAEGRPVTLRGLATIVGVSHNRIWQLLHRLKKHGLVEWESKTMASLMPRVLFLLPEDLA